MFLLTSCATTVSYNTPKIEGKIPNITETVHFSYAYYPKTNRISVLSASLTPFDKKEISNTYEKNYKLYKKSNNPRLVDFISIENNVAVYPYPTRDSFDEYEGESGGGCQHCLSIYHFYYTITNSINNLVWTVIMIPVTIGLILPAIAIYGEGMLNLSREFDKDKFNKIANNFLTEHYNEIMARTQQLRNMN